MGDTETSSIIDYLKNMSITLHNGVGITASEIAKADINSSDTVSTTSISLNDIIGTGDYIITTSPSTITTSPYNPNTWKTYDYDIETHGTNINTEEFEEVIKSLLNNFSIFNVMVPKERTLSEEKLNELKEKLKIEGISIDSKLSPTNTTGWFCINGNYSTAPGKDYGIFVDYLLNEIRNPYLCLKFDKDIWLEDMSLMFIKLDENTAYVLAAKEIPDFYKKDSKILEMVEEIVSEILSSIENKTEEEIKEVENK